MTQRYRPYLISIADEAGRVHEPTPADLAAEAAQRLHHVLARCGENALRARAYVLAQMDLMSEKIAAPAPIPTDFRCDRHWPALPARD
ncbi:hypothetical protein SAMN05880582_10574 [Rhizobium sp. RU20A]|uniref:hypothetical protein n=1 Tax=Rhizobium sp. RU20A TaxID=1907412 RepID=UPI000955BB57|nr:hypothetical protein [Rhizobium sp. RU20A]SIQ96856.1 hypothetical protein SAMN05880582_10574 [Rhizobium sp. RU20A]